MSNSAPQQLIISSIADLDKCRVSSGCVGDNHRCYASRRNKTFFSVKTRIQAASEGEGEKLSVKTILLRIFKEEGIPGYYRGFVATMLNTFSMRESPLLAVTRRVENTRLQHVSLLCYLTYLENASHMSFAMHSARMASRAVISCLCRMPDV